MSCLVEQLLGGGGQGEVYRVSVGNKPMALKWYYPHTATPQQRSCLAALVNTGPPSLQFLWPIDMVSAADVRGYGYLMPLREHRFKGMPDLLKRRIDVDFRSLASVGMNLAHGFLQLHARGLSYGDISNGNVFFDPKTGEVLICDNDNVTTESQQSGTAVMGTPRFMAPEIVRGHALPSTQTDLYSLSVLLFYLLLLHHPLEGGKEAAIRVFDEPAMTMLFGNEPVFIFDPDDESNRPVPGYQDNPLVFWPIYPQFLRRSVHPGLHPGPPRSRSRPSPRERMAGGNDPLARRDRLLPILWHPEFRSPRAERSVGQINYRLLEMQETGRSADAVALRR